MSRAAAGRDATRREVVRRAVVRRVVVRLPREQRVQDILAAAREVFCERGYNDAAMSEIAARIDVVEGTLYKYFESKRELLLKVLENWYEDLFGDYTRELPGIAGAHQKLRYLVWRHLRTIREYPMLSRLMFLEVRSRDDYIGSNLHAMNLRYTSMFVEVVRDGIAQGQIRPDVSTRTVRDLVYGGLEHLTWNFLGNRGRIDIDRRADEVTAILWRGIAVPALLDAPPTSTQAPALDAAAGSAGLEAQLTRLAQIADRMERAQSLPIGAGGPPANERLGSERNDNPRNARKTVKARP